SLLTYTPPFNGLRSWRAIVGNGWTIDSILAVHGGLPLNISTGTLIGLDGSEYSLRPSILPGRQLYVYDITAPGHQRIDPAAFSVPPGQQAGNLGRNILRQFSAWQLDIALRRIVKITERWSAEMRAETFNILNHPNFGSLQTNLTSPNFGKAMNMLASQL